MATRASADRSGSTAAGGDAGTAPPWVVDALLGTAVTLAIALIVSTDQGGDRAPDLMAYLFAVGFGGLMLVRRIAPRSVLVLTVLGLFAYYIVDYPVIGVAVPVVAALFAAADAGLTGWAVGSGLTVFTVSMYFRTREGEPLGFLLGYESVSNIMLMATAIALGFSMRTRRIRTVQQAEIGRLTALHLTREADLAMRRERERISRDLHDTVGHTLSVISLHAQVATEAIGHDDAVASRALGHVRTTSSRSLRDLGSMVRILRSTADRDDDPGVLSLSSVETLAATAGSAGLGVETRITVRPAELSPAVDAAAYRVVQEALTNVIRHADATHVQVSADIRDGMLHVTVVDDGHGSTAEDDAGGQGLGGMGERLRLLGGGLVTRSVVGSGFTVEARMPARVEP